MGFKDKFMNAINDLDKLMNPAGCEIQPQTRKQPRTQPQQPIKRDFVEYDTLSFTLQEHYKDFKIFPMSVHGYKENEINNDFFSDTLPGKTILFVDSVYNVNIHFYKVYINNLKVGAIFEEDQIQLLRNNKIEAIAAKLEIKPYPSEFDKNRNAQRIKLFVKLINN